MSLCMPSSDESLNEIREHVRTLAQVPYDDVRNEERLRDHFAGLAMHAMVSTSGYYPLVARDAYAVADDMLAEKRRRG